MATGENEMARKARAIALNKARIERETHYTRLHHLARLAWLNEDRPTYACGTPVEGSTRQVLTEGSRQTLHLIAQGFHFNHVDMDEAEYLAELNEFEKRSAA
jgi:hypothetical protein